MYQPGGFVVGRLLNWMCPMPPTPDESFCSHFWVWLTIFVVLLSPFAIRNFYLAGKWLWLKIIPSWATI